MTCPRCGGSGVLVECQLPGFCPHINDREYACECQDDDLPPEPEDRP